VTEAIVNNMSNPLAAQQQPPATEGVDALGSMPTTSSASYAAH